MPQNDSDIPNESSKEFEPNALFLTVFTPTFQRAHTLPRVYESLRNQTGRNFEWVVVDDGSTDVTESLVNGWIDKSPFPIRYAKQENSGKHIAWNRALEMARGHYFLCLDSDDALAFDAVATLESDLMPQFGKAGQIDARAFLLMDPKGNPYGHDLQETDFDKSFSELEIEGKLPSDVWFAFRTEILRKFPFPEKFRNFVFPEGYMIRNFDRAYPIRFAHNRRLGFYYRDQTDALSLSASISLQRLKSGSALTLYLQHLSVLQGSGAHFRTHPLRFIKSGINYVRFRNWAGKGLGPYVREIEPFTGKVLAIVGILPGHLLCIVDRIRLLLAASDR